MQDYDAVHHLFIVYVWKMLEDSNIESRVILQSVTKFNEQYAFSQIHISDYIVRNSVQQKTYVYSFDFICVVYAASKMFHSSKKMEVNLYSWLQFN